MFRLILAFLLALPLVHALESEHYISVEAGDKIKINETIKLRSENWFMDKIYLVRENVENIEIHGIRNYKLIDLGNIKIVEAEIEIPKGKEREIRIKYEVEPETLGDIKVFKRKFFSNYAWRIVYAEIEIQASAYYSFGEISPKTSIIRENGAEKIVYKLNRIDNFTELTKGMEITIFYGDYKRKAVYEIRSAEEELADAKTYESAFNVSVEEIKKAEKYLKYAYGNFSEKMYYKAFLCAKVSKNFSKEAVKRIIFIKELKEKEFKEKIEKIIENLTKQENMKKEAKEEKTDKILYNNTTIKHEEEKKFEKGKFAALIGLLIISAAIIKIFRRRKKEVPGILIREKEYSEFDVSIHKGSDFYKKITSIKRIDSMANELFNLKKEKRELEKKLKTASEEEKENIVEKIEELSRKIIEIEKELERAKKWRKLGK